MKKNHKGADLHESQEGVYKSSPKKEKALKKYKQKSKKVPDAFVNYVTVFIDQLKAADQTPYGASYLCLPQDETIEKAKKMAKSIENAVYIVPTGYILTTDPQCQLKATIKIDPSGKVSGEKSVMPYDPINHQLLSNKETKAFESAYMKIGKGRSHVNIYEIRRELNWNEERFNNVLTHLASEKRIELQGGNPENLSADELKDSYVDELGYQLFTITWR